MVKRCFIDFESRSQCDIWTCGAYRYAEDPTTEILCLAWAVDGGPVRGAIHGSELRQPIKELNALVQEGAEFHAHNAFFERCMWKHKFVPLYGALPIPIRQWRCTAAKVSAHALPRALANAAAALGCTHKKDLDGAKVMKALASSTGVIDDARLRRLLEYCEQDVRTERDIDQKLPDLCPSEQEVWFMDQYLNDTGVCVDVQAVRNAAALVASATEEGNKELFQLTGGQVDAGTKRQAIKAYLETKGLKLPNLQKQTIKDAIATAGGNNLRVLQLRQQLSLTSNAKYGAFLAATSPDGRIRDLLVYHGASTGRWSGKLVQIQNLVKAAIKPQEICAAVQVLKSSPEGFCTCYDVLPTLSSCIRGMLIPSPGHTMFITDFAAIEARVVMWLAGETTGLKAFAKKDADPSVDDIYVLMAKQISPTATRQLGKQTVLGCGFGMGVQKFIDTCAKYEVAVTPQLAERAVGTYRKLFSKVPKFWYAMEDAARQTIVSGKPHGRFFIDGDFLRMKLPSGRTIVYHHPRVDAEGSVSFMAVNSITNKYEREQIWGGKLVENCLAKDTKVLTLDGVKDIVNVKRGDKVWDGENWVETKGCVNRGVRYVGELAGIRLTAEHKILVGSSWKSAIGMTENTWRDALRPGLSSVASACSKAGPGMPAKLYVAVLAHAFCLSPHENSSGEKPVVRYAGTDRPEQKEKNTEGSCPENSFRSGFTDTRVWLADALIRKLKHMLTTVVAALGSIWFGWRIAGCSWNLRGLCPDGTTPSSIWTELKTIRAITPGIYASAPEKLIAVIGGLHREFYTAELYGRSWISGKSFALVGKAITLLYGTLAKERQQSRLWKDTGKQEAVYDLLNCGPNARFMILSSQGPIVVHNCVQATARDLMVAGMFGLLRAGYRILFTVHDELVVESKAGSCEEVKEIVCRVPTWAKGCPINAECESAERYKK